MGDRTIAAMRRQPIVINTARGGLVGIAAVVRTLDASRLRGIALNLTELEPIPAHHPLRSHPQAVLTPHVAYDSAEAKLERAADEVARALSGERDPR